MESVFDGGGWWAYLLVFVVAAVPVIEILVVIPAAMLAGLPAVPVVLVAVAGNLATVVLVALAGDRMLAWWRRRRPRRDRAASRRSQRARAIALRWGVPGAALLAPITTGSHVATLAALAIGSDTRSTLRWMGLGLVVWAVAVAFATAVGLDLLT